MKETEYSFIETINLIRDKLPAIVEASDLFDADIVERLEDLAQIDISLLVDDLRKGNYLGNRKIDINLSLNMIGIETTTDEDIAENIWTDESKSVSYDKALVTFVDGDVVEVDFVVDGYPVQIATHTDLLIQLNNNAEFLAKAEDTLWRGQPHDIVGEFVRFYDVIGSNSNIERITLNATTGSYKEQIPTYFWSKTTSAFQTLAMRAGDVIKLGNDIDSIILLAKAIEQMLELQARIPEFVDTFDENDNPNGDETLYNRLSELVELHAELTKFIAIYNSLDNINVVGNNTSNIDDVADDLNLGESSNIIRSGENIEDIKSAVANEENINAVVANEANINTVAESEEYIETVVLNLQDIKDAYINAKNASDKADEAEASSQTALEHLNEITGLSATAIQLTSSQSPTATYNSTTGLLTIGVPQGLKGDRGEAFNVDASGTIAERSAYNGASKGFAYLTLNENPTQVYFKASDTAGDWTNGLAFGKGDKGDKGDKGNGIQNTSKTNTTGLIDTYTITYTDATTFQYTVKNARSIVSNTFTSTTDISNLAGKSGATDTYTTAYNDGTTSTYNVYNGLDSAVTSVAGKNGEVTLVEADITDLNKYTKDEVDTALSGKEGVDVTILREADIGTKVLAPDGDASQLTNLPSTIAGYGEVGSYILASIEVASETGKEIGSTHSGSLLLHSINGESASIGGDTDLRAVISDTESIGLSGTWRLETRIYNNRVAVDSSGVVGLFIRIA